MRLAGSFAILALLAPCPAFTQNKMVGVNLTSPAFTKSEFSRTEIVAKVAKLKPGEKLDLSDKSLNGLDSPNSNSPAPLRGANFSDANFAHADLEFANLGGANFAGADLSHAEAAGADFRGAHFSGAKLDGLDVTSAHIDASAKRHFAGAIHLNRVLLP